MLLHGFPPELNLNKTLQVSVCLCSLPLLNERKYSKSTSFPEKKQTTHSSLPALKPLYITHYNFIVLHVLAFESWNYRDIYD